MIRNQITQAQRPGLSLKKDRTRPEHRPGVNRTFKFLSEQFQSPGAVAEHSYICPRLVRPRKLRRGIQRTGQSATRTPRQRGSNGVEMPHLSQTGQVARVGDGSGGLLCIERGKAYLWLSLGLGAAEARKGSGGTSRLGQGSIHVCARTAVHGGMHPVCSGRVGTRKELISDAISFSIDPDAMKLRALGQPELESIWRSDTDHRPECN